MGFSVCVYMCVPTQHQREAERRRETSLIFSLFFQYNKFELAHISVIIWALCSPRWLIGRRKITRSQKPHTRYSWQMVTTRIHSATGRCNEQQIIRCLSDLCYTEQWPPGQKGLYSHRSHLMLWESNTEYSQMWLERLDHIGNLKWITLLCKYIIIADRSWQIRAFTAKPNLPFCGAAFRQIPKAITWAQWFMLNILFIVQTSIIMSP